MAVAVSSSFALTIFVVLAGIVVAMGTVLMILGLQIPPPPKQPAAKNGDDEDWELEFL